MGKDLEEKEVKEKKNKGIIATLIILIIIILGLIGYIVYDKGISFTKEKVEEKKEKNNKKVIEEEKDITDTTIISNLDQKIAYIDNISSSDSKSNSRNNRYAFRNGEISDFGDIFNNFNDDLKLRIVLDSLLDLKQFESVKDKNNPLIKDYIVGFSESMVSQISVSKVEEQYQKFFGNNVSEHKSFGECFSYKYDQENKLYFRMEPQCGGTNPNPIYSYKNRYSVKGNEAYVYVNYGSGMLGSNIYKDIMNKEIYKSNVSDEIISNFKIDSTNYQDFSEYKFTFEKDKNNNYYFKSLERIK